MINITCQDSYAFITVLNGCSSKGVGLKKVLLFSPWLFSCVFFPHSYDLVDVTRNSLQVLSLAFYEDMMKAYKANDTRSLK